MRKLDIKMVKKREEKYSNLKENIVDIEEMINIKLENESIRSYICGKNMNSDESISFQNDKSKEGVHSKNAIQCEVCSKTFAWQRNLNMHIAYVHKENSHNCDICNKSFPSKQNLTLHIKTVHNKEKNYDCVICGNKFGEKVDLNEH